VAYIGTDFFRPDFVRFVQNTGLRLGEWRTDDRPSALAYSSDGSTLLVGLETGAIQPIETAQHTPQMRSVDPEEPGAVVRHVEFAPNGETFATAAPTVPVSIALPYEPGKTIVWRARDRVPLFDDPLARDFAYAPDSKTIAIITGPPDVTEVELRIPTTGFQLKRIRQPDGRGVSAVAFAPDGLTLATALHDVTVRGWDTATGQRLWALDSQGEVIRPRALAFFADGTLASGFPLRAWSVADRLPIWTYGGAAGLALAVSPDGQQLAGSYFGNNDTTAGGHVQLLTREGAPVRGRLPTLATYVGTVAYSPDSLLLAYASSDGLAILRATDGRTLGYVTGSFSAVAFSPLEDRVLAASWDGAIHMFCGVQAAAALVAAESR
jgi:WD40 repeat protein